MFAVGCGVALLTLSVSVALTVLVPLVAKGYLKKEDTLPYIAGANITTLADTLVAAILLGNPDRLPGGPGRGHRGQRLDAAADRPVLPDRAGRLPGSGQDHASGPAPGWRVFLGVLFTVPIALIAV